jgi:hypothetical protein
MKGVLTVLLVLVVGGLLVLRRHRAATDTLRQMSLLLTEGRHAEVLAFPDLPRPYRPVATRVRATSALLTSQFPLALRLLDGLAGGRGVTQGAGASDDTLRAGALIGLGRYEEAAGLLGPDPAGALDRHQRAQVAVLTGDDVTAERLLAAPDDDPDLEAGRLRILGDFRARRLRFAEGDDLLQAALARFELSQMSGHEVDAAYCRINLATSALAQGGVEEALVHLAHARGLLAVRPDHAAGYAALHCAFVEAHATAGDAERSALHLAEARRLAEQIGSPAVDADVAHASAVAAWTLRRPEAADLLSDALVRRQGLGEWPDAHLLTQLLRELPRDG